MGLLRTDLPKAFYAVADHVYAQHFIEDKELEKEYSEYRKKKMYEDTLYNLSFLETAKQLNDEMIFINYAKWLYGLMVHLMQDVNPNRIRVHMMDHYRLLKRYIKMFVSEKDYIIYKKYLDKAMAITKEFDFLEETFEENTYSPYQTQYLNYLLSHESMKAKEYIFSLVNEPFSLHEIYTEILTPAMKRVGELWYKQKITAQEEHYMTSITQTIMTGFYDQIFEVQKKEKSILTCSIGGELHQMGARMLSDILENQGYDTYYLGAITKAEDVIDKLKEHNAELLAISVTIPHHLKDAKSLVEKIKKLSPKTKIVLGGRATQSHQSISEWPIDLLTSDTNQLITWLNDQLGGSL